MPKRHQLPLQIHREKPHQSSDRDLCPIILLSLHPYQHGEAMLSSPNYLTQEITVAGKQAQGLWLQLPVGATTTRKPPAPTILHSLVRSSPPQLSSLAVRITRSRLQVTIAVVEDWVQGYISLIFRLIFYFCTREEASVRCYLFIDCTGGAECFSRALGSMRRVPPFPIFVS